MARLLASPGGDCDHAASHLMGRIMGLLMFSSSGLYPLSTALAGVLTNQFGPTLLFPFSALLLALAMLFGMTQKVLREL